jgi:hypothetical protein
MCRQEEGQSRREWEDEQGPLVLIHESENSIDGNEVARDGGRMTAWLWIDT